MNTYRAFTLCSVAGLLLIGLILGNKAARENQEWEQAEAKKLELKTQAELEAQRVELAKQTANVYQQNQIMQLKGLIIERYTYDPNEVPRLDWLPSVDPEQPTQIFDQHRRCIGLAEKGEFYFLAQNPDICNQPQTQE